MRSILVFLLLLGVRATARLFFRLREDWMPTKPKEMADGTRIVAILNHTSLYEPLVSQDSARRSALGMLYELYGRAAADLRDLPPLQACTDEERKLIFQALAGGINCPRTSSAGRLFDAIESALEARFADGR